MDPIAFLTAQHREVDDLFDQFEALSRDDHAALTRLAHALANKWVVHAELEETLFYPVLKKAFAQRENREMVLEAFEEHRIAKVLLADILTSSADQEAFIAKMTVLRDVIDPHIIEEEEDLFALAKDCLPSHRLEQLGLELEDLFRQIEHAPPRLRVSMMQEPAQVHPEHEHPG